MQLAENGRESGVGCDSARGVAASSVEEEVDKVVHVGSISPVRVHQLSADVEQLTSFTRVFDWAEGVMRAEVVALLICRRF